MVMFILNFVLFIFCDREGVIYIVSMGYGKVGWVIIN